MAIHIEYLDDITSLEKSIIKDYWDNNNGGWVFKAKDIFIKYSMTSYEIQIIREKSHVYFDAECSICKSLTKKEVKSRTGISKKVLTEQFIKMKDLSGWRWNRDMCLCDSCLNQKMVEQDQKRKEYLDRIEYEKRKIEEVKILGAITVKYLSGKINREEAFNELGDYSLNVLKMFYKLKSKQQVYKYLFNDDYNDSVMWEIFECLNTLNLLHIKRDAFDRSVMKFHKHHNVAMLLFTDEEFKEYLFNDEYVKETENKSH